MRLYFFASLLLVVGLAIVATECQDIDDIPQAAKDLLAKMTRRRANRAKLCGKREVFRRCGTACRPTCETLNNPPECTKKCVRGCQCKKGFVLNNNNKCIKIKKCPPPVVTDPCENVTCTNGLVCQPISVKCLVAPCPTIGQCVCPPHTPLAAETGCEWVRYTKENGCDGYHYECVSTECPANAKYNDCGMVCKLTCRNFAHPPTDCQEDTTCVKGCECENGYVENDAGECVLQSECPPIDLCQNVTCPDGLYCQPRSEPCFVGRCPLTECVCPPPTPMAEPGPGCRWDRHTLPNGCDGYSLECEQCRENAHYNDCGSACIATCSNYADPPRACTNECIAACECDAGFVENGWGECVTVEQCALTTPKAPGSQPVD